MKREDFKEITKEHIEMAERIIKSNGSCDNVECENCPFSDENSIESICYTNRTSDSLLGKVCINEKVLELSKEFLEICGRTGAVIGEGTAEKFLPPEILEDNIKSPNHYKLEGLNCETIDVVKARLGKDGFKAFCVGNVLKYVLRAEKKNGLEDYKKSRQYLDWIIEGEEK